jgi:hypothetical protein
MEVTEARHTTMLSIQEEEAAEVVESQCGTAY